jgi:dihydrofolate reductase
VPVFVLTHHARETVTKQGGTSFTFVTDGIEAALEQAQAAAGNKDVAIAGGASIIEQYLRAGLLDEFQIHLVPVLWGTACACSTSSTPSRSSWKRPGSSSPPASLTSSSGS